jgi:thiol-disulfide isomerase/thioredoxin
MRTHVASALLALTLIAAPVAAQTTDESAELQAASRLDSPAEAVKALETFLAKHPQSKLLPAAHYLLVRALVGANAPSKQIVDEAKLTLSLVPPADPDLTQFRLETVFSVTSTLVARKEMLDAAREIVKIADTALPSDPDVVGLHRALALLDATVLEAQGKRDEALAAIRKVVAEDPDNQAALVSLAEELQRLGRTDEAIDAYVGAEAAFEGDKVDGTALRDLYRKQHGSLDGLDQRLETARAASLRRIALDSRRVDAQAPDWELKDLDGTPVKLSAFKGQVVVIDFWATWCPPCREELPHIQALDGDYSGKGVRVLAVNVEGSDDAATWDKTVRAFVHDNKYTFTVVNDFNATVNQAYKVDSLPSVFVVDKTGKIRYFNRGFEPSIREVLKAQIDSLLGHEQ